MIDFDVAMDKLCSLESSVELADFFRGQGVKGVKLDPNQCPIATWVQETTGYPHVAVVPEAVSAWGLTTRHLLRQNTAVMRAFIFDFDAGFFSDLERERSDEATNEVLAAIIESLASESLASRQLSEQVKKG